MTRFVTVVVVVFATACSRHQDAPAPAAAPAGPPPASAPATPPPASAPAENAPIAKDPGAAKKLIATGALVLDVRTSDEYDSGHIDRAINVPVDEVSDHLAQIAQLTRTDKSKPIVVYCAAGRRAARAKRTLEEAGYTNVVNGGGYDDLH
jgi:phage shock protein E